MRKLSRLRSMAIMLLVSGVIAVAIVRTQAQSNSNSKANQAADQVSVDPTDIGGVVSSAKGPEAGVWVIAETTELPTKFRKIVVTDDRGRYLIPDLPKANYKVWVRGYGLVDSSSVQAAPGQTLALTAVLAPTAKAAAQYYPANYWYSLLKVPPKSAFPLAPEKGAPDGPGGRPPAGVQTQANWITTIKECEGCHQMGTRVTREISPYMGAFDSPEEAWDRRVTLGQLGAYHQRSIAAIGHDRAMAMFADWTKRIQAGELPPVPPRPEGVERNLVVTIWDIGTPVSFLHDLYVTDKRNPTVNAYGPVYAGDYNSGNIAILDPKRNMDEWVPLPTRDDKKLLARSQFAPTTMKYPSLYWGDEPVFEELQKTEIKNVDEKGRLWMATAFRAPDNPAYCKEGSSNKFAQYFPLATNPRQVAFYDGKTKKQTWVDVCFNVHHAAFGEDKDDTIYWIGNGTAVGWVKPRIFDETGDAEKSQGWCPAYYDMKGDGKYDPKVDKLIPGNGYYGTFNPVDGTVWYTVPGVPGKIVRMDIGSDPPLTCHAEAYEPPFNNPKAPEELGFDPHGIEVDRSNGVIWVGLGGSGQIASFDRRKCKVLTGPESFDGQHCVEGWTLYSVPGPKLKDVNDQGGDDYLYGAWVDQFNTLGLGKNVPLVTGTNSDSLLALMPDTHKWVVLRVPYPMGFFTRNMTGRIDDPNAGWKGRGLWAGNEARVAWHIEGGKGTRSEALHLQMRPDPLAK